MGLIILVLLFEFTMRLYILGTHAPRIKELEVMNILLLYPEFPDTFWSFKHALPFIGKKAALPPLGLLTIASMLPGDWEKRLVDLNVCSLKESDLDWADFVFISAMTVQRDPARSLVARCNAAGVPIVGGGPLFQSE